MILLDTNVFSQPTRVNGSAAVIGWIDDHFAELLVPVIAVAELLFGAYRLPDGEQRDRLRLAHDAILLRFQGKIVDFDLAAARLHGKLVGETRRTGQTLPASDAMVAAIALSRGLTVATRNTKDFARTGVALIDPWEA